MDEFVTEYLRAILLLGITTFLWVVFRLKHKHADASLRWLGGLLDSYAITAGFWTAIIGIAIGAAYYSSPWILHLVLLILFTKAFGAVTFIEVSSTIMSIVCGIDSQSNSRLDYRVYVVEAISIVALLLMFFYFSKGLPENPAIFP